MIPIQNFYTGENAGVILPDADRTARSLKDFYEQRRKEGDQRLAQIQEKEKLMLDYSDVSPIQLIASEHQALQALKLDEFNKEASKLNPITSNYVDLMKIKQKRSELEAWQGNLKMNQDAYMRDRAKMATDPDKWRWNKDAWAAEEKSFKDTGIWNSEAAFVRNPGDWRGLLSELPKEIFQSKHVKEIGRYWDKDAQQYLNKGSITSYSLDGDAPVTLEEMKSAIASRVLGSGEIMQDMSAEFGKLVETQPEVAQRYLDAAEADGQKGSSDIEINNAIVRWGLDQVPLSPVIKSTLADVEQKPSKGINFSFGFGGSAKGGRDGTFELIDDLSSTKDKGTGIRFDGGDYFEVSSTGMKFPEGYKATGLVNFKPTTVINGVVEGLVQFKNPVLSEPQWVGAEEGSAYKNKVYPTEAEKAANPELEEMVKVRKTLPPKDVTIEVPLSTIKPALEGYYDEKELNATINNLFKKTAKPATKSEYAGKKFMYQGAEYSYDDLISDGRYNDAKIKQLVNSGVFKMK